MNQNTLDKLNSLNILSVADHLGIRYSGKGWWRKALCFCHDDHAPSLGINESTRSWKCFSCGKGGGCIQMVMEHERLGFEEACQWLVKEFGIPVDEPLKRRSLVDVLKEKLANYADCGVNETPKTTSIMTPGNYLQESLIAAFQPTSNELTRALVQTGILTPQQMQHATARFRLSTVDEQVVFWQIDQHGHVLEGKAMSYQADAHRSKSRHPVSVSSLLKKANKLPESWRSSRCLFGLHQLREAEAGTSGMEGSICAIVESEKTAVICSELIPQLPLTLGAQSDGTRQGTPVLWMATGGKNGLSVELLKPLKGKRVILFPDTDTSGSTFNDWLKVAQDAGKQFGHPVTVSDILELHATPSQKGLKIDIADLLVERLKRS